ncbi:MAG TPA: ABC transporter substrate-binding protein [Spirochaetia bacterium]|nr:ABC transporter substrate-binding protein [Spirochaetia bacterium]
MKKRTLRIFALVSLFALAAVGVWAGGAKEGAAAAKPVKIGFIGPLTGDYANYGKLMTQAIKIAVEERNAKGGISGHNVELVAEDSEGKQEKAVAAMEKLASVDQILGLVGAVFSSSSLAIAPRAQQEKIVMISPSSTHPDLTNKGNYIFRDVVSDAVQAQVFAKYVYEKLGLRKVAILYTKNDYSQGLADGFKAQFESDGGSIVASQSGMQGDKDFKTQLTTIKAANPEAIYMPDYVAEINQILQQAAQLGITKVKMLSSDGFSNPEILQLAGPLANGVVYSGPELEKNPLQVAFEQKYQAKWTDKPDSFSLNSYDAANILFDAIQAVYDKATPDQQKSLTLDREAIRQYVAGVKGYQGVSGEISFASNGDAIKNQGILTVENQQYKQLGVYKIVDNKLVQVK